MTTASCRIVGATLVLAVGLGCGDAPPASMVDDDPRPNLVLVVLDTVRADHSGAHGGEHTPHLDRLAERSVVFSRAWSTAPWTVPSHASMFTGALPSDHGCTSTRPRCAFDAWPTVAERLAEVGYETAAFYSNPWLADTTSGLLHGFESTWSTVPENGGEIVSAVGRWLDDRDRSRPFFLFVNLLEAHVPYDPPPEIRATLGLPQGPVVASEWVLDYQARLHDPRRVRWDGYRQLYAGDVRWADLWFGELLGRLRGALGDPGFDEDLAILVTSDHGELLGEDGLVEHQLVLHDELLAVPLVVRAPGLTPERRDAPVSGVDIAPTLLDLAGVEDSASEGRSLLDRSSANRSIFAEYSGPPEPLLDDLERRNPDLERDALERRWRAVRRGDDRLFVDSLGGARTILSSSEAQPEPLRKALREVFGEVVPPARDAADPFEIDAASRERLRALGYIQ